jgi:two-component sensor histidine kinase
MDATPAKADPPRWLWIATVWLALGLFDAAQTVFTMQAEGMHHAWARLFATLLLSWLPWALATPWVVYLGHRYPVIRLRPLSTWLVHLSACTAIGLVAAAWIAWLTELLNPWLTNPPPGPYLELLLYKFYEGLIGSLILYSSILAFSYVFDSRARLARQETEAARLGEQLSQAQLNALRRQIEPHFLFNTLNAIAGLVREKKNDAAVNMIAALSDFLRGLIEDSTRQQVPLEEELVFLQKYLDIQKMRFAERLQVSVDVPTEFYRAQVPTLILQPVVENAVKHGIGRRAQGGAIRISVFRSNGMLTLSVYNDGPNLPDGCQAADAGTGIRNLRTRLHSLFGNAFDLKMENRAPSGVEVSVSVPFREE